LLKTCRSSLLPLTPLSPSAGEGRDGRKISIKPSLREKRAKAFLDELLWFTEAIAAQKAKEK